MLNFSLSKVLPFGFLFLSFLAGAAEQNNGYCLEAMANLRDISKPIQVDETFSGYVLTWNGSSIFRKPRSFFHIGESEQEIWSLAKFKESGEGATGFAPLLQVKKAQTYFISKLLHQVGKTLPTADNARSLDEALAACESVSDQVSLDGQIPSREKKWVNGGELSRELRGKIRSAQPDVFAADPLSPRTGVK